MRAYQSKTVGRIDNNRDNEMLKTQFEPFLDCEEESPPKSASKMGAENFHDQIELTGTRLSPSSIDGEIFHQQIEVMMSKKSDTFLYDSKKVAWTCNLCGKQGTHGQIKRHIEAKHITGVRHKCDLCHKTSKSRYALKVHKKRNHDFWITKALLQGSCIAVLVLIDTAIPFIEWKIKYNERF